MYLKLLYLSLFAIAVLAVTVAAESTSQVPSNGTSHKPSATSSAPAAKTSAAKVKTFAWDCTNSIGPCNNFCYAANHKAKTTLTFMPSLIRTNRRLSGASRRPCRNTKLPYHKSGDSCDEYPFASTKEGGINAFLRCANGTENKSMQTLIYQLH